MFKLVRKNYYKMITLFSSKVLNNFYYEKAIKLVEKEPSLYKLCDLYMFKYSSFTNSVFSAHDFDKVDFVNFFLERTKDLSWDYVSEIVSKSLLSKNSDIMELLCRQDGRFFSCVNGSLANDKLYDIAKNAKKNAFSFSKDSMIGNSLDEKAIRWVYEKNNDLVVDLLYKGNTLPLDIIKDALEKGFLGVEQLSRINLNYLTKEEMIELCKVDGRVFVCCTGDNVSIEAYREALANGFTTDYFQFLKANLFNGVDNDLFLEFCQENGNFFGFFRKNHDLKKAYEYATNNADKNKNFSFDTVCLNNLNKTIQKELLNINGKFLKFFTRIDLELYRLAKKNGYDISMGFNYKLIYMDEHIDDLVTLLIEEPSLIDKFNSNMISDKNVVRKLINEIVNKKIDFPLNSEFLNLVFENDKLSGKRLVSHLKKQIDNGIISRNNLNLLFNYSAINTKSSLFKYMKEKVCDYYHIDYSFLDYQLRCGSKINKDFATTLNPELLQDKYRVLYEEKGHDAYNKLYVLGTFPDIQKLIIDIGSKVNGESLGNCERRIKFLKIMLDKAIVNSNSEKVEEWIPNFSHIVNYFYRRGKAIKYFADHLDELDDKKIELLVSHALGYHRFPINSMDDLEHYDEIRRQYIDRLYVNETSLESVREAFLEEYFGISPLIFERLLMFKDGILLEPDKYDKEIVTLFEKLSLIEKIDDPKKLLEARKDLISLDMENLGSKKNFNYLHLMLGIKKSVLRDYNNTLYKISKNDSFVSYEGSKFYKVAGEDGTKPFSLSITSLGAYSDFNPFVKNFSFKTNWNMPLISSHGICSSYIANNNIGTARVDYVMLGFTDYEESSLLTGGPYDLVSSSSNKEFDSFSTLGNSMFLHPRSLIDYTRHTHNEYVFERRYKDGKRQPSYVVLDVDDLDEAMKYYESYKSKGRYINKRKLKSSIEDRRAGRSREEKLADSVYFALKCSKDFNIPIVTIERDKVCQNEWKKIVSQLKDFMGKDEFSREEIRDFLHGTLVEFENNVVGNTYHPNIKNKYFNINNANLIVDTIKSRITVLMKENPALANIFLDELEYVCQDEDKKMSLFRKNRSVSGLDFIWIQDYINRQRKIMSTEVITTKYVTDLLEGKIGDNECLMEYSKILTFDDSDQFSVSDVRKVFEDNPGLKNKLNLSINMIDTYKLYVDRDKTAHSRKHVEDVVLFSAFIGHSIGLSDRDMDLLLTSAAFHDAGRIDDRNVSHAITSAQLVEKKLINVYSEDEIKMIQSIIEFHEVRERKGRDGEIDYQPLYDICQKYGLDTSDQEKMDRCKKMSSVLKDADAIDRTRFIPKTRAFFNHRYLRNDVSRRLFKVGEQLNEYYSKRDIEVVLEEKPELIDSFKAAMDVTHSPKEVIRMYRKGRLNQNGQILESEVMGNGAKK